MARTYAEVSRLGPAFLPGRFADACSDGPIRRFAAEGGNRNQAVRFLKRGGTLVVTGAWPAICALHQDILKREDELVPAAADRRERALLLRQLRRRMLTTLDCLPIACHSDQPPRHPGPPSCHPEQSEGSASPAAPTNREQILHCVQNEILAGFLGEESLPEGIPTLLPIQEAERLLAIPSDECPVRAIGAGVVSHPDVLAPRSQETIELICEAIRSCEPDLPEEPGVLDVGCGSGVLSIAAWQLLRAKSPSITATDILPEAVATTRLNWRRLAALGKAGAPEALTTHVGDLFAAVSGQRFDLIIFNAPWVTAPARNRRELALNDERQRTITAFVQSAPNHLSPGGRIIVGYSDNSGSRAIARLEECFTATGLTVHDLHKDRIHTRRAKRQWQSVYAYVLGTVAN